MHKLIKLLDGQARVVEDSFVSVPDEEIVPATGDVILGAERLREYLASVEGQGSLSRRALGLRILPDQEIETFADLLGDVDVVEVMFPKFRDGRGYTTARLLRDRLGYAGEIRASGDVLREQALFMIRCGFDAFVPADGSVAADWQAASERFRHVYQAAADARRPAFQERTA